MLGKPHVKDGILLEKKKLAKRSGVPALRVLREYVSIGLIEILALLFRRVQGGEIELRTLDELPGHMGSCIASIECREEGIGRNRKKQTRVTLWPKLPALDSLAKMCGFDKEKLDEEMAAQASGEQAKAFDPSVLTDEQWELYKQINQKRLEQLGK